MGLGDDRESGLSLASGHKRWACEAEEDDIEESRAREEHVCDDSVCERDVLVVKGSEADDGDG